MSFSSPRAPSFLPLLLGLDGKALEALLRKEQKTTKQSRAEADEKGWPAGRPENERKKERIAKKEEKEKKTMAIEPGLKKCTSELRQWARFYGPLQAMLEAIMSGLWREKWQV